MVEITQSDEVPVIMEETKKKKKKQHQKTLLSSNTNQVEVKEKEPVDAGIVTPPSHDDETEIYTTKFLFHEFYQHQVYFDHFISMIQPLQSSNTMMMMQHKSSQSPTTHTSHTKTNSNNNSNNKYHKTTSVTTTLSTPDAANHNITHHTTTKDGKKHAMKMNKRPKLSHPHGENGVPPALLPNRDVTSLTNLEVTLVPPAPTLPTTTTTTTTPSTTTTTTNTVGPTTTATPITPPPSHPTTHVDDTYTHPPPHTNQNGSRIEALRMKLQWAIATKQQNGITPNTTTMTSPTNNNTTTSYCPFALASDEQVRVISGEEEAVFDWAGVNFLLGDLYKKPLSTHPTLLPHLRETYDPKCINIRNLFPHGC